MKKRKVPFRKCIVTGEMLPKAELIRVVRNKAGEVFVDDTGKQNGRGAYLKKDREVIEKARKVNQLQSHLNVAIDPSLYDTLVERADKNE